MNITRVALDLAKQVIQVHAVDRSGRALVRKPVRRAQLLSFFRELPPCEVGMEACSGAHHWGRQLQAMGHRVRLLPPQYVKPFVLGQKNDANDAAAICAAMARHEIPAVVVKTIDQQDQQALHRIRSARVAQRTRELMHANRELESFAYSVSHDLRAPLRSVEGFARVLGERHATALDEDGRGYLSRIRNAALRMDALIDALLRLSRITREDLKFAEVDMDRIALDVIADLMHGHF